MKILHHKLLLKALVILILENPLISLPYFLEKSSIELNTSSDIEFNQFQAGGKISVPFIQAKYSQQNKKYNYGVSVSTENLFPKISFKLQYGTLSAGGSLSKLNNLLLSASSTPFSHPSTDVTIVSTSLPAYSSFSNPSGVFIQSSYSSKNNFIQNFSTNTLINPETERYLFSTKCIISPVKKIKLQSSITAGLFHYEENTFSSWFTDKDFYYHEDSFLGLLFQNSLQINKFNILTSLNTYETFRGDFENIYKLESVIKSKHITYSLSSLYNGNKNIITGSQKKLSESLQFKSAFQFQFPAGKSIPMFTKIGINVFSNLNLKDFQNEFRITTGIQLSSIFFSFSMIPDMILITDYNETLGIDSCSIKLNGSWYFKKLIPSLAFTAKFSPSADYTSIFSSQKLTLNIAFQDQIKISLNNNLSFSRKNGEFTKKTLSSSLNLRFSAIKKINCIGKLTVVIEF